jgi:hypothetical protein
VLRGTLRCMSAIEPRHHAEPTDFPQGDAGLAADDARRRQRWRTQRLFDLAVIASMAEPWRIARAIGIDERSMREMRDVPTLRSIARIGGILGIEPGTAAGVVGLGNPETSIIAPDLDGLHAEIARADIEDDTVQLERLAETVASAPLEPGDLSLSILCAARAAAARGEACIAHERAKCAEQLGFSAHSVTLASQLLEGVKAETVLGEAWSPFSPKDLSTATAQRGSTLTRKSHDGASARRAAATVASELLHAATHGTGKVCELIASLHRQVAEAIELGCPHAIAWSASIAGIAALRLREVEGVTAAADRAAMSLFVASQFAIDERIASDAPRPSMSLLRRRLRLALHEWCDRARRGEVAHALLDEVDESEVRTMIVRFPRAQPIGLATRVNGESGDCIFESRS